MIACLSFFDSYKIANRSTILAFFRQWHRLVHPRIDQAFGITPQDILRDRPGFKPVSAEKAAEVIKAYYNDGDNDSLGGSGGGSGQL